MDASVLAALTRWPNVPHVYGWLRLDRRGQWRLQGEIIRHQGLIEFIGRNYLADAHGNWFFQNGPQRVYVALDYTPWVVRSGGDRLRRHDGLPFEPDEGFVDDEGSLLLAGAEGIAVVDDRDLQRLIERIRGKEGAPLADDAIEALFCRVPAHAELHLDGRPIPLQPILRADLQTRFGFNGTPRPSD